MGLCGSNCVPTEREVGGIVSLVCRNCGDRLASIEEELPGVSLEDLLDCVDYHAEGEEFCGVCGPDYSPVTLDPADHPVPEEPLELEPGEYVVSSAADELVIHIPADESLIDDDETLDEAQAS